jgi:hypothetical protein
MSDALPEVPVDTTLQHTVQVGELKILRSALEKQGGTLHVGPVSIDYALTTSPLSLKGTLSIVGVHAGAFEIDEQHPEFDVDLEVHGIGAKGKITLDAANQNVNGQIEVDYVIGKKQFSGVIYHW